MSVFQQYKYNTKPCFLQIFFHFFTSNSRYLIKDFSVYTQGLTGDLSFLQIRYSSFIRSDKLSLWAFCYFAVDVLICFSVTETVNCRKEKRKMNRICFAAVLLFFNLDCLARQLIFSGYTIADGLSQSVVTCIMQDSRGYLWIGTQNGLNRFNGYNFEIFTYKPYDTTSISNNWIYGMAEDHNGNLWIGTKGGLNKFLYQEKRFQRIRYATPFPAGVNDYVYDVKCSRNGSILINTPPVLTVCDPEKLTFMHAVSPLPYDGSVKDYNIPLLEDTEGRIWTGSSTGLAIYLPDADTFKTISTLTEYPSENSARNITALCLDNRGEVWAGTAGGLIRFSREGIPVFQDYQNMKNAFSPGNLFIRALVCDKSGRLWIGTEGGGVHRISMNEERQTIHENFTSENSTLFHNIVLSLAIDHSQNLWLGTLSGVNKTDLKKRKFNLYRTSDPFASSDLAGNVIASLFKDKKGKIWVGHWGKGLDIYDRKSGKIEHYSSHLQGKQNIPNDFVHSVMQDSTGNIWVGTRDGLVVFREKRGDFIRPHDLKNPIMPDFEGLRIFRMIQGKNGDFWIATQNGLYRVHNRSQPERYHSRAPEGYRISGNLVYTVLEDREGAVWVGTTDGLDRINPVQGGISHFKKTEGTTNSLSDNFITALCEDHNGDIWIGTSSYVNKYSVKDSVFTYYSKENGLPGNLIYGILQDQSLGLWFATGNGLCRYDFKEDKFHTFSVEDGLQSQEFNLGASCLSRDGEVFFGGMNGFNSFYPDSLAYNRYIPAVVFSAAYKIRQGAKEYFDLGRESTILLNHNDDDFTVEFAGLEFTNPGKNKYMYRLEGGESDWIDIGNRNFVTFSHLSPGEYTLRVKGSNNDGFWNEEGAALKIRVRPPWWGSNLAYTGYLLLLFMTLFLVIKKRERQHSRERKILEEKVMERTRQIERQKTEIMEKNRELSELNVSKDKFFSIIAHDLRNPFHAITGLTDLLLMDLTEPGQEKIKKSLENIRGSSQQAFDLLENLLLWARSQTGKLSFNPKTVNLKTLIEECISLVSAQAAKKNITIAISNIEDVFMPVDVNMMQTVLRNLLTNALKFSHQDGEVRIGLSAGTHECTFIVKDNGIGIPPEILKTLFSIDKSHKTRGTAQEPGTGLGLILCREFVLQHGGKIETVSTPGIGSEFRVILPFRG